MERQKEKKKSVAYLIFFQGRGEQDQKIVSLLLPLKVVVQLT